MENALYHVLLEGRRVGPYDRRTIIGMRIKKTLTSAHVLVGADGIALTVADLVKMGRPDPNFQPSRSGSYSVIQATYTAYVIGLVGKGYAIPGFKGEIEVRMQTKALRLEGRFRQGFGWRQDRVKVSLQDVAHTRVRGSTVDLWLRMTEKRPLQCLTLELFMPETAAEFATGFPGATPWPEADETQPGKLASSGPHPAVWGAVVGTALAVAGVLVWALTHRI